MSINKRKTNSTCVTVVQIFEDTKPRGIFPPNEVNVVFWLEPFLIYKLIKIK